MKQLLFSILLLCVYFILSGQAPPEDRHWNLVFEEQFDTIDPEFWKVANDFDHYGEPQVYTSRIDNVFVSDGELVLRVNRESYRCRQLCGWACNKRRYDYTSGWIESTRDLDVRFGYLESRIRIPHGFGFWPAFWTFIGEGVTNPHNAAEIDIFEMLGNDPPTIMGTNLHLDYCNCGESECGCAYLEDHMCPSADSSILCHQLDVEIPDYSSAYHIYAVEWNPSKIIWYVDGRMVRNSPNPGIVDPVRIIFNLAVTPWKLPDKTTPFPSSMNIDYLKVYQMEPDTARIDSCHFDLQRYDWSVKKEIVIGGEGCTNLIPFNEDITIRATGGIEIRGDFSVPLGAQLYLDVNQMY